MEVGSEALEEKNKLAAKLEIVYNYKRLLKIHINESTEGEISIESHPRDGLRHLRPVCGLAWVCVCICPEGSCGFGKAPVRAL